MKRSERKQPWGKCPCGETIWTPKAAKFHVCPKGGTPMPHPKPQQQA